ncbi:MAG: efflux RND transporter periplasmic adaptor subunit [Candidatus Thiodiazotropha sp. L084R]
MKREFREGADIAKGDVLYRIDPSIYQAELASAKASLAQSRANLKAAKSKADGYKNLVSNKAVSQQEYDDADASYKQAEASVELANANLQRAEIDLNYTKVKSPINGRIGRSSITQGALVTANQVASLATVQQLDPVYVDLTQSSVELLRLRQKIEAGMKQNNSSEGVSVRLELEDGTIYPHHGKLAFSEVTDDENTGSVTLRAVFPNPEQWLLPGMFVRAKVDIAAIDDALMLPPLALSRTAKGEPSVMVVSRESTVQPRILAHAEMLNGQWLVKDGVKSGDRVIVGGLQKVFPGMPVQVNSKDSDMDQDR